MTLLIDTIFCDDIRSEMGGKLSYMGVYGGGLFVSEIPATLPKLCLAIRLFVPIQYLGSKVVGKVLYQDDLLIQWDFEIPNDVPRPEPLPNAPPDLVARLNMVFHLQLSPLTIKTEGYLRVRLSLADEDYKGGTLRIAKASDRPADPKKDAGPSPAP